MDSRFFVIITLFALFAVLHSGEALKCYECNSELDDTCSNKLESKHESTCFNGFTFCVACHAHVVGGKDLFVRGCIPDPTKLVKAQTARIDTIQCTACSTDLCNAASTNVLTLGWLAVLWMIRSIFAGY